MPRKQVTFRNVFMTLATVGALTGVVAPQTCLAQTKQPVVQTKNVVYSTIDFAPASTNADATKIATALLQGDKAYGEYFTKIAQNGVLATFVDNSKDIIAAQVPSDCGKSGCHTFIFVRTDVRKNHWSTAFEDNVSKIWSLRDDKKQLKIITQPLRGNYLVTYALSNKNTFDFVSSTITTAGVKP